VSEEWQRLVSDEMLPEDALLYYPLVKTARGDVALWPMMQIGRNTHRRKATHFIPLPSPPSDG
jgi:hypothetical protein